MSASFVLGQVCITPGAMNALSGECVRLSLARHARGDWGDLDAHDIAENERALKLGGRLFSAYHDRKSVKFWIITEADRSATTILLPSEY